MSERDGCNGCKYESESEDSIHCAGCKQNATDKYEPMTNADKIRSMTDEELAWFLWEQNGSNRYWKSVQKHFEWLKAETEGEAGR